MKTDIESIIAEAESLIDEVGLEGFTTRTLATRLGVRSSALYHHFKNKNTILALVVEAKVVRCVQECSHIPDWKEYYTTLSIKLRDSFATSSAGCSTLLSINSAEIADARERAFTAYCKPLIKMGFNRQTAIFMSSIIGTFSFGWAASEQSGQHPHMSRMQSIALLKDGLQVIFAGLEAKFQQDS